MVEMRMLCPSNLTILNQVTKAHSFVVSHYPISYYDIDFIHINIGRFRSVTTKICPKNFIILPI